MCPVCMASHQDLDSWHGNAVSHIACSAEATLMETRYVHELFPEASTYEFKQEVMKCGSGLSGAVEEFCWEGLPVGPDVFIVQDLLHGCYKFVWDHITEWLVHIIGEDELDRRFKAQPNLGFCNFTNGISKISQTTGREHRTYLRLVVPIIAGHGRVDHRVLMAIRSLVDYIFMAHYPLISETDLETMEKHLMSFHSYKDIFIQNGARGSKNHLQIPKLHALLHYLKNSYQLGVPDNFSTETPKSLHIRMCKEPYKASNCRDFDHQILNYLDVQDHLTLCHFYEIHRASQDATGSDPAVIVPSWLTTNSNAVQQQHPAEVKISLKAHQ
jgi:hypothetical protein